MIAIPGSNPIGNVLHLILGPESELIADIHGATIMDVTLAINKFSTEKPIFVSISRCKSEIETSKQLTYTKIEHINSLPGISDKSSSCDNCGACGTIPGKDKEPSPEKVMISFKDGVCAYCNSKGKLLPIPGQKICMTCAQIELGCKPEVKKTIKIKPDIGVKND